MTMTRYDARVSELPMFALFEARGAEKSLAKAIAAAGLKWPKASGAIDGRTKGIEVMRFGPARVLIRADLAREDALGGALDAAFAAAPDADVAMVSDMFRAFRVTGPGAEDVLRQGAPLDLSPAAFPPGSVAATEMWTATVIVSRDGGDTPSFTLMIDNSYAGYLADWLAVANGGAPMASPGVMTNPPRPLSP
ncbi:MAG: sarcosine oxidase subunit gamma [Beijerinckiaceae bacterium]